MTLSAPTGTQLNAGDQYTLDINFTGAANPSTFSFAALWSDSPVSNTSVPEPTTLSLSVLRHSLSSPCDGARSPRSESIA
ncbi:MAG: hypothetical protein KGL22_03065 [Alphaproteobacteria bacterium]|nr:hypothetical protein [Alphaproteobacteria bacterium]